MQRIRHLLARGLAWAFVLVLVVLVCNLFTSREKSELAVMTCLLCSNFKLLPALDRLGEREWKWEAELCRRSSWGHLLYCLKLFDRL